jgi:hypothetical protein
VLQRNTLDVVVIVGMIKKKRHIFKTQQPGIIRGTSMVKDTVGSAFDGLGALLSWSLVLLIRLTLPAGDTQGTKDVMYLITNDNLSTVTNELMRSSTISNIVFQGVDKLLIRFDAIDISDLGISSYKVTAAMEPSSIAGTLA